MLRPPQDPTRWGKLSEWGFYGVSERVNVRSHSTTMALARAFIESGWSVHIIIYALDTLASPASVPPGILEKEREREFNALLEEFYSADPRRYEDIVERSRRVINFFLDEYLDEAGIEKDLVEIYILPGTGRWKLRNPQAADKPYNYIGSPLNMQALLEIHLAERLQQLRPDALVLDISHGINYMPALSLRVLERLLVFHTALRGEPISVAVMQSDPVSDDDQESLIHVVEAGRVGYSIHDALEYFVGPLPSAAGEIHGYRMLGRSKPPEALRRLRIDLRRALEEYWAPLKALMASNRHGLALYALHLLSEVEPTALKADLESLEDSMRGALRYREVHIENGIVVLQPYVIIPGESLNVFYALELLEALASLEELKPRAIGAYRMFSLSSLRRYLERIRPPEPSRAIAEKEIDDVEARTRWFLELLEAEPSLLSKPTSYSTVYAVLEEKAYEALRGRENILKGVGENQEKLEKGAGGSCSIDKRNFYAHAGMERNALAVILGGEGVYVGYHPHCLDSVKAIASKL